MYKINKLMNLIKCPEGSGLLAVPMRVQMFITRRAIPAEVALTFGTRNTVSLLSSTLVVVSLYISV
jgi:hypothetical protein